MEQPLYKMGDEVEVELEFEHKNTGITTKVGVVAKVCGVSYNYEDGTVGGPYYHYEVAVRAFSQWKTFSVLERDIIGLWSKRQTHPKINVKLLSNAGDLVCSHYLDVLRVEHEDDGSLTAVVAGVEAELNQEGLNFGPDKNLKLPENITLNQA